MKWTFAYIVLFIFGVLEYLPVPYLPESGIEWVQRSSLFLPWIGLFGFSILFFLGNKKNVLIPLFLILCFVALFPSIARDGMNRLIVTINNGKELNKASNIIVGVRMIRNESHVSYLWSLVPNDYEELIYLPNHNMKNDNSEREIIEVINKNWFIQRTGLFE